VNDGSLISPVLLIEEAERYGLILELDRLFRKKALENFRSYHTQNRQAVLSINLDSSAICTGLGSKHLLKSVEKYRIDPSCIIIEILESEVEDINVLVDFVSQYRSQGFMIAMDDFGAGFSNWDRIIKLKPDIIKLDISIIRDIDSDFLKQEVARSLIKLSHNTGSLVVAEGIETEGEALKMLELNADILQGFFLAKPMQMEKLNIETIDTKIEDVSTSFREARNIRLKIQESELKEFSALTDRIIDNLKNSDTYLPEQILIDTAVGFSGIECIYILDECGIQISETVVNISIKNYRKSRIFHPDDIYSDQSNKDYYFNLVNGYDRFISEPYISTATGNLCITISRKYQSREGERRILCVDIKK
jgi:EAL domain-containing protein (putative c-di-GMP-specific phosphodiesterase class I)